MDVPCEMLLHPELLTNEQLKHIIEQRKLKVAHMEYMSREELLILFHQYCVPYGQRKHRDSGRGNFSRTRHLHSEPSPKPNTNNRKLTHYDGIKPPPDLLSGHMKRIRLEITETLVNNDVNSWKRKMSISPTESPPPKKDRKPITWP